MLTSLTTEDTKRMSHTINIVIVYIVISQLWTQLWAWLYAWLCAWVHMHSRMATCMARQAYTANSSGRSDARQPGRSVVNSPATRLSPYCFSLIYVLSVHTPIMSAFCVGHVSQIPDLTFFCTNSLSGFAPKPTQNHGLSFTIRTNLSPSSTFNRTFESFSTTL